MNLTEFLWARVDEDKRRAEAMRHWSIDEPFYDCPATRTASLGDLPWGEDACDCGLAARKARALREVEAKRAIVAAYVAAQADVPPVDDWYEVADGVKAGRADGLKAAAGYLAAAYSDHPDYRPEWAL